MNNRIVKIPLADIALNYREASDMINKACGRYPGFKAAGICESDVNAIVSLEESPDYEDYGYVFSPFPSENEDDMIGEINSRYYAGFSMIGDLWISRHKWGLFAFSKKAMAKKSSSGT